jgi:hypothetical protein
MRSPFVAAAMCEALCSAADLGVTGAREGVHELSRYLRDTREVDGSWRFEPHERPWPPDADSTACSLAALARADQADSEPILGRIVDVQTGPDGLIRPFLLWYSPAAECLDGNVADAIVTANVLLAASRIGGGVSSLVSALEEHVRGRGLRGVATAYYDSLPVRSYYLARTLTPVWMDGPAARAMRRFLSELEADGLNVVDVAAAVAAAALLGVTSTAQRLLPHLLALREPDGAWAEARWFVDRVGQVWGSAAFSTALAVEALALVERRALVG